MATAPRSAVYYGVKKTAQTLKLSENRVRQLADNGSIPCIRDSEGRRTFAANDVLASKRTRQRERDRETEEV